MRRLRVHLVRAHDLPTDEARNRLERLVSGLKERFPGYNVRDRYEGPARRRLALEFAKAGKGEGTGSAEILDGRVELTIDALYNLPFFVPMALAERILREEMARLVEVAFRIA